MAERRKMEEVMVAQCPASDMAVVGRASSLPGAVIDSAITLLNNGSLRGVDLLRLIYVDDRYAGNVVSRENQNFVLSLSPFDSNSDWVLTHAVVSSVTRDSVHLFSRFLNAPIVAPTDTLPLACIDSENKCPFGVRIHQIAVVRVNITAGQWLAKAVEFLPILNGCGVIYQVQDNVSIVLNQSADSINSASRYIFVPNGIIQSHGIPRNDWYGRPVEFEACMDQPEGSERDASDGKRYKAITVDILATEQRTDIYSAHGQHSSNGPRAADHNENLGVDSSVISEWQRIKKTNETKGSEEDKNETKGSEEVKDKIKSDEEAKDETKSIEEVKDKIKENEEEDKNETKGNEEEKNKIKGNEKGKDETKFSEGETPASTIQSLIDQFLSINVKQENAQVSDIPVRYSQDEKTTVEVEKSEQNSAEEGILIDFSCPLDDPCETAVKVVDDSPEWITNLMKVEDELLKMTKSHNVKEPLVKEAEQSTVELIKPLVPTESNDISINPIAYQPTAINKQMIKEENSPASRLLSVSDVLSRDVKGECIEFSGNLLNELNAVKNGSANVRSLMVRLMNDALDDTDSVKQQNIRAMRDYIQQQ